MSFGQKSFGQKCLPVALKIKSGCMEERGWERGASQWRLLTQQFQWGRKGEDWCASAWALRGYLCWFYMLGRTVSPSYKMGKGGFGKHEPAQERRNHPREKTTGWYLMMSPGGCVPFGKEGKGFLSQRKGWEWVRTETEEHIFETERSGEWGRWIFSMKWVRVRCHGGSDGLRITKKH